MFPAVGTKSDLREEFDEASWAFFNATTKKGQRRAKEAMDRISQQLGEAEVQVKKERRERRRSKTTLSFEKRDDGGYDAYAVSPTRTRFIGKVRKSRRGGWINSKVRGKRFSTRQGAAKAGAPKTKWA